ncbi:MAG: phosphate ABC transporter substrate-binding protein [Pseudomonadota bacterium]
MRRIACLLVLVALSPGFSNANDAAELVVIVNPDSGIDRLTRDEVIDIFLGRYRKLPSGRAALPIDVSEPSTERARFYQLLVKKSSAEISSYWARLVFSGQTSPPFQVPDAKTAVELVQSNPNAIAYVDRASVTGHVKVVLEIKP